MKYDRTKKLFGEDTFEKFKDVKLILLGVGGVGSFALDALYNTGITNITIVTFTISNVLSSSFLLIF